MRECPGRGTGALRRGRGGARSGVRRGIERGRVDQVVRALARVAVGAGVDGVGHAQVRDDGLAIRVVRVVPVDRELEELDVLRELVVDRPKERRQLDQRAVVDGS